MREIVGPQQAHSLNQDLPLAKEKDRPHTLAQSHDQTNGGGQQQGKSSCLQWCWPQVMLHEKKQEQQQVMVVEKRRMGGAVVMEDEMAQVKVEYIMVALVLPPVEGEEQGQVVE